MQIPNTLSTHHKPAVIKCIWRQIFYAERKKCQAFRSNNCEHLFFQKQKSIQQFTFKLWESSLWHCTRLDLLHWSHFVACVCAFATASYITEDNIQIKVSVNPSKKVILFSFNLNLTINLTLRGLNAWSTNQPSDLPKIVINDSFSYKPLNVKKNSYILPFKLGYFPMFL